MNRHIVWETIMKVRNLKLKRLITGPLLVGLLTLAVSCSDSAISSSPVSNEALDDVKSDRVLSSRFRLQSPESCINPCTFSVATDLSLIERVIYSVDAYMIGESKRRDDDYSISYAFSRLGARQVLAVGYDRAGQAIAKATQVVEVEQSPAVQLDSGALDVPYFYQYDNAYAPSKTCQNTSIAMLLNHLGVEVTPDQITAAYGKDYAQSPEGLADLFNIYAARAGLAQRLVPTRSGTLSGLREELDRGHPVITHGYFTSYGHVLVVTGYDQDGYYANDPAGRWSESFMGGYPGLRDAQVGRSIYYRRSAFEAAVATSDGYSALPLWYHALRE